MAQSGVDLTSVFNAVTRSLAENQNTLNQADGFNQDHGDNMVQTFQTITRALQQKRGSSTSVALSYAAKQLGETGKSSSSKLYAENLSLAAAQLKGKKIDLQGLLQLLQTLIGGKAGSGDLLGSLLGGLLGGQQSASASQKSTSGIQKPKSSGQRSKSTTQKSKTTSQKSKSAAQKSRTTSKKSKTTSQKSRSSRTPKKAGPVAGGGLLGGLLGGLAGGEQQVQKTPASGGGDLLGSILGGLGGGGQTQGTGGGDLLGSLLGGLTGSGQQGGEQGLASAFMGSSGMGDTAHRTQSTQIVVDSFLKALGGMEK